MSRRRARRGANNWRNHYVKMASCHGEKCPTYGTQSGNSVYMYREITPKAPVTVTTTSDVATNLARAKSLITNDGLQTTPKRVKRASPPKPVVKPKTKSVKKPAVTRKSSTGSTSAKGGQRGRQKIWNIKR